MGNIAPPKRLATVEFPPLMQDLLRVDKPHSQIVIHTSPKGKKTYYTMHVTEDGIAFYKNRQAIPGEVIKGGRG